MIEIRQTEIGHQMIKNQITLNWLIKSFHKKWFRVKWKQHFPPDSHTLEGSKYKIYKKNRLTITFPYIINFYCKLYLLLLLCNENLWNEIYHFLFVAIDVSLMSLFVQFSQLCLWPELHAIFILPLGNWKLYTNAIFSVK